MVGYVNIFIGIIIIHWFFNYFQVINIFIINDLLILFNGNSLEMM